MISAADDEQWQVAHRLAVQTRQEIWATKVTTQVQSEELGWLGLVTARRCHAAHGLGAAVAAIPTALVRCMACQRLVLLDRMHTHRQQCDYSNNRNTMVKPAVHEAKLNGVVSLGKPPLSTTATANGAAKRAASGSGLPRASKKARSQTPEVQVAAAGWEFVRPLTNLSKVTYASASPASFTFAQLGLLDSFLAMAVDHFSFPPHLRKPRAPAALR